MAAGWDLLTYFLGSSGLVQVSVKHVTSRGQLSWLWVKKFMASIQGSKLPGSRIDLDMVSSGRLTPEPEGFWYSALSSLRALCAPWGTSY